MFMLDNKPLAVDTPFTHNEIQYPANWLRLSTAEEKAAIGISEVPDAPAYDDRFYWAPGVPKALEDVPAVKEDGTPLMVQVLDNSDPANPRMVDSDKQVIQVGLKSQLIAQVKQTAGSLLAATDWKITRAAEGVKAVDADTLAARAAIRAASDANEAAISACTTVEELAALQLNWPQE